MIIIETADGRTLTGALVGISHTEKLAIVVRGRPIVVDLADVVGIDEPESIEDRVARAAAW